MIEEVRLEYEQQGFIVIPNILDESECENLKCEARKIIENNSKADASVFLHASHNSEVFTQYHRDRRLLNVLNKLMLDGIMFLSDKVVIKTAEKTFPTPWHIDRFYWPETRAKLSVWIALDDANADNGTLTVVPRSHLKNWTMKTEALANGEFLYQIPETEINPEHIVICNVKRGSAVIFSDRLVHGSTSNLAGIDRFTVISTYHAATEDEPFDLAFPAREILSISTSKSTAAV